MWVNRWLTSEKSGFFGQMLQCSGMLPGSFMVKGRVGWCLSVLESSGFGGVASVLKECGSAWKQQLIS